MIGYLDLASGISGDVLLGCLIDAGWPADRLREAVDRLGLPAGHWAIEASETTRGSLRATRVEVLVEPGAERRGLADVAAIVGASSLPAPVKAGAMAVFTRLASAEARVHGTTVGRVHFHEVGALDAIVDIVGTTAGLSEMGLLGPDRLFASALPMGAGWTQSDHGPIPLPAPATLELLSAVAAPTRPAPGPGELVTPTGAALLAEFAAFTQPAMSLRRVAVGAGSRQFAWPNVARLWLGEPAEAKESTAPEAGLVELATNIDDMSPQLFPAVTDRLLALGALDVWLTAVQMKKGRPGVLLGVLARSTDERLLAEAILRETTTLGVRVHSISARYEAGREFTTAPTPFGPVRAKVKLIDGRPAGIMPEYEDCRRLAESAGAPVRAVHDAAVAAAAVRLAAIEAER